MVAHFISLISYGRPITKGKCWGNEEEVTINWLTRTHQDSSDVRPEWNTNKTQVWNAAQPTTVASKPWLTFTNKSIKAVFITFLWAWLWVWGDYVSLVLIQIWFSSALFRLTLRYIMFLFVAWWSSHFLTSYRVMHISQSLIVLSDWLHWCNVLLVGKIYKEFKVSHDLKCKLCRQH